MESSNQFEFMPSEGYTLLKLDGELSADSAKEFKIKSAAFCSENPTCVLVNCEDLSSISANWLRELLMFGRQLESQNKLICYVSLSDAIKDYLKEHGVLQAFHTVPSLKAGLVQFGLVPPKALDVNFINPFLNATIHVLKVQTGIIAHARQIYKKSATEELSGAISAVIAIVGDQFSGSLIISFPENTFLKVMSKMMGENCSQITDDIKDGASELTNMIFGQAKTELNERGYNIKTALPSIVRSEDVSVQKLSRGPRVVIPFSTDDGEIIVEVCSSAE